MAFASSRIGVQEAQIIPCDLCESEDDVNWFCRECVQNLCDSCKKIHLRSTNSKTHNVVSILEGLKVNKDIEQICAKHSEHLLFRCRKCDVNICAKCLAKDHKSHDFIDLGELYSETKEDIQKSLDEKESEKAKLDAELTELTQYEADYESYVKECESAIDEQISVVKEAADEVAKTLKGEVRERQSIDTQKSKDRRKSIQQASQHAADEIEIIRHNLLSQSRTSISQFHDDVRQRLRSLHLQPQRTPKLIRAYRHGRLNRNDLRRMIGELDVHQVTSEDLSFQQCRNIQGREKNLNECCSSLRKDIVTVAVIPLKTHRYICSLCVASDGNIWLGCHGLVRLIDKDGSEIICVSCRNGYYCIYITCLSSCDALVSYGNTNYIDRFTRSGNTADFANVSPNMSYDIAVTSSSEVLVRLGNNTLLLLSENGTKLKYLDVSDFTVNSSSCETYMAMKGNEIAIRNSSLGTLQLIRKDGSRVGEVIKVPKNVIIKRFICDDHGHIVTTDGKRDINILSMTGTLKRTYHLPGKTILSLARGSGDDILVGMEGGVVRILNYLE